MRGTFPALPSDPAGGDAAHPDGGEELYVRSRSVLRPALAGRLGSLDDAEDVLHEAFLRFLSVYSGRAIANPLALLARIAMNIVRDLGRSERTRRLHLSGGDGSPGAGPPPHTPEAICVGLQGVRRLQKVIDGLPPRCREVFLLHRLDGMPHAEVASTLGISRSMVEKHLARAHRQIRTELEGYVDSAGDGDA